MVDVLDRQIIHALQAGPRASFRDIAAVVGSSEQTVSRRYQALRRDGVVRVLARIAPAARGHAEWIARIRSRPDRVAALADTLARRHDLSFAHITSGGTEIICIITAPADTPRTEGLLQQLPKTVSVLDLTIDLLLHRFGGGPTTDWSGYDDPLTDDQRNHLTHPTPRLDAAPTPLEPDDEPLLAALAYDGRAGLAHLAAATGWTAGRVARRLDTLEATGTLYYDIDLLPERLGYHLNATLWLRVPPHRLQSVGDELARHPQTAFVGATSGAHNVMAVVICRDTHHLYHYLTTNVAAVPDITEYETSIRVRRVKQAESLVTNGRLTPTPRPGRR